VSDELTVDKAAARPITCLLVDDHPAIINAVAAVLQDDGIEVVGRATNAAEALQLLETLRPAVALVDWRLPGLSGIDVIRAAARVAPETATVLYTGFAEWPQSREALDAGARGIISKESPLADVARAISLVAAGKVYLDAALGGELVKPGPKRPQLTQREREVLRLLADGLSHEEIGAALFLSSETVRAHAKKATTRLGARNRMQAVAAAVRDGLIA
jgi:DNA-binding NarL/FixJ family response regulator